MFGRRGRWLLDGLGGRERHTPSTTTEAAILRVMAAARLDGTPAVVGLLRAYGENRCPELNERIDALVARGEALTTPVCEELHRRYLAADSTAGRARAASGSGDRRSSGPVGLRAEIRCLQSRLAAAENELGRDHLTGLANRRRLEIALAALIGACRAEGRALSVAAVDVDRFKAINDRYGHAVGDGVLRLVAAILSSRPEVVRLAARLGGDEFVLALPDTPLDAARRIIDELRRELLCRRFVARVSGSVIGTVSISAGVAEMRRGEDAKDLLRRADAALYAAKHVGRNAVAVAAAAAGVAPAAASPASTGGGRR